MALPVFCLTNEADRQMGRVQAAGASTASRIERARLRDCARMGEVRGIEYKVSTRQRPNEAVSRQQDMADGRCCRQRRCRVTTRAL
eukprot:4357754-Prymnesium_polylepis.3